VASVDADVKKMSMETPPITVIFIDQCASKVLGKIIRKNKVK
jgi:hypothetical protein